MHLFEVNDNIIAASVLIEIAFHDNWEDASFIIENIEKIGIAITEGIIGHLSEDRKKDVGLKEEYNEPEKEIVYVDRIVEKIIEKEIIKEVPIEIIKEVEKIIYVDKIIEVSKVHSFKECIQTIVEYIKSLFKN